MSLRFISVACVNFMFITQAAAAVVTSINGGSVNAALYGYAQAGGREATAISYVNCIRVGELCSGSLESIASNTYSWNISATEGAGGQEIPLIFGYTLWANSTASGGGKAEYRVIGGTRGAISGTVYSGPSGNLSSNAQTLSGEVTYLYGAPAAGETTQLSIELTATAFVTLTSTSPTPDDWRFSWAVADPYVMIDPTYSLASNFTLEEVANEMQFETIGDLPENFDLAQIPTELVGVAAVPVPAAAWLFGSGLIGFVGMSRRRKVS